MLTMILLTSVISVISVIGGGVACARGKKFERRGCPRCRGPLERGGSGLRCRPCLLYWTLEGHPVGHVDADEHLPRAQARPRRSS